MINTNSNTYALNSFSPKNVFAQFETFILDNNHPCVMAQTVFKMNNVKFRLYPELGTKKTAKVLIKDLEDYVKTLKINTKNFLTFIAVFPEMQIKDEQEFETLLWKQLHELHQEDQKPWDKNVSQNPESKEFSFSIAGQAFYVVGMHPNSSRMARQSPYTELVFNLHKQFEQLREMNAYTKVRDRIRQRDKNLQGTINPMLADFGSRSEARQYSGRQVDQNWKCPYFHQN